MSTKSSIVSGMGLAMSIITGIVEKVKEAGGTEKDIHLLATPDGEAILRKVADIIANFKYQVFKIVVDYTISLKEMIEAGRYDFANNDIGGKDFLVKGDGKKETEITLFYFDRDINPNDVIVEMEQRGFRPANIEELLALGATYPEIQNRFPIAALGFTWDDSDGHHIVLFLGYNLGSNERKLSACEFNGFWSEHWRFAAVRK